MDHTNSMRRVCMTWTVCVVLLMVPTAVWAQATITGTARDTSGAVLPGVTVEAASPALIERVRAVITDSTGQYPHRRPEVRHLHRHVYAAWLFDVQA